MIKTPKLAGKLIQSMQELKQCGYIVPAETERKQLTNYLPYFLTNQAKPRVVFDGSATWKELCINDIIYSGPDEHNRLSYVLARFRLCRYALMAELSKCFWQILLLEEQQNLFRILWFKEDDVHTGKIEECKFTRHVWGIISSPYVACCAIRKVTEENLTQASEKTIKTIQRSMYMDDLFAKADSLDDARTIASESIELFKSRGFQLVKWSANKETQPVLVEISGNKLAPSIRTIDLGKDDPLPYLKAVGCLWDSEQVVLKVQFSLCNPTPNTRRSMLSDLSRQYDPLGYSVPLLLKARLILQEMAIDELSWDELVDERCLKTWNEWLAIRCTELDSAVSSF